MVDINQLKSEGLLPELEEPTAGTRQGHDPRRGALHPLRVVRQAMPVRRHYDGAVRAAEISTDGRLYKESYRDAQLAGTPGVAGGTR
jgi:hypothetical protein